MSSLPSDVPFGTDQSRSELATRAQGDRTHFRTSVVNLDRPGDPSVFGEKTRAEAAELIARYPAGQERSALLPLLHLVQSEQGFVSPDGIAFCADLLGMSKAQVVAVATFYTMYKRKPTGEYLVSVCRNTLCGMLGGDEIFAALSAQLGVGHNGTTSDGKITLEHAECLAACDYAPIMTVNYEFFDNQTVGSARNIVSQLQSGERPMPARGAPLCTFKEIERQIAGFHDAPGALAPDASATGAPTEAGVKLAIERGDTAPSFAVEPGPPAAEKPAAAEERSAEEKPPAAAAETAADEPTAAAKQPASRRRSTARKAAAKQQPTSEHDAPLETSGSDPAHPAKPGGEEAK